MVFADHFADDTRAFFIALRRIELQSAHRPEQAALNGFQPIAQVGQRSRGNRRHRINKVAFGQRAIERRVDDCVERVWNGIGSGVGDAVGHRARLASGARAGKGEAAEEPNHRSN